MRFGLRGKWSWRAVFPASMLTQMAVGALLPMAFAAPLYIGLALWPKAHSGLETTAVLLLCAVVFAMLKALYLFFAFRLTGQDIQTTERHRHERT
ncbi:hypothetical protein [Oceaniglobus trochenteri]|uniref:hypothetical protein n=1 Tax=Oceaniglobus trochenteri TaxID=2763260 RepID=UPI001CFF7876|nr:hypothetical protein [Oceaniglobus trochenteri]